MTPHEHLSEADKLIDEATGLPMDEAAECLTFAQFHIQIASAAAHLGIRDDLAKLTGLSLEEAERRHAIRQAAVG
jgi:hypothetical protein